MKAITTTFHGPTETKPSRITASDSDGNRVTISVDSVEDDDSFHGKAHDEAARALCIKMDWVQYPLMGGDTKTGRVYVFDCHANRVRFSEEERSASYLERQRIKTGSAGDPLTTVS